jgi:hypothetical protein
VPFELNNRLADTEGTVHGAVVGKSDKTHPKMLQNNVQQKASGLLIYAFVAFLCLPFITINHAA